MIYTVSEKEMLYSIISYLEEDGKTELTAILQCSDFVFEPKWEFSGIISNQKKLYASLRVPIKLKDKVDNAKIKM